MRAAEAEFTIHRGGSSLTVAGGVRPTPEQLCLIHASTGDPASISTALREWRSLVDLAGPIDGGSYRLIPTVYHRMQAFDIDDPNRAMFKGVYRRSMVDGAQVAHAVTPALQALRDAHIMPWIVKGAGLVQTGYYPTLASRPMQDVDVVVDSRLRHESMVALRGAGYVLQKADHQMVHLHAAPFVDGAGNTLDLHWHHLHDVRYEAADRLLTKTSTTVDLNDVPVRVPGATGLLIGTLVHGMVPNPEPSVRWIVDVSMILERDADKVAWDDVVEFARQFRLARRLQAGLQLLAETTGHTAPDGVTAALATLPTTAVERVDRRISAVPEDSIRGRLLQVVAGYAGGDRGLRHVVTGLPSYLAGRWDVRRVRHVPVAGLRALVRWLRRNWLPS